MRRRVHYILSTHWDREWYQTFQDFRYRLVKMIDSVLAGWQSGELKGPFQTDGQAILLEDYLEVRPERRTEVEQRAREGRLVIGPWYVLPDEFLVSGESLVRNLRLGRETARRLGGTPSNAGFLCDMFGHNSQMPQIFTGFGISAAFVWRGVNLYEPRHFIWRGADNTPLPAYRFGWNGYCTYATAVRGAELGAVALPPAQLALRLEDHLQMEARQTSVDPILAFDGGDHMGWDRAAYAVLAARIGVPSDTFEIVHSSLDDYLAELKPEAGKIMPFFAGELREPARESDPIDRQWLIPGVTSSRVWIKQANAACESLLCQWAEPFSALSRHALGSEDHLGYLNVAWKWLISNHPHDSMCGCSIDAVHEDMRYRFAQTREIGERLALESTRRLAASVTGSLAGSERRVVVFNPLPRDFNGVADLTLDTPPDWPTFVQGMVRSEPLPAFRVFGPDGQELPYQRLDQTPNRVRTHIFDTTFPQNYLVNEVRLALPLTIPACGYTTLVLRPAAPGEATRHPQTPGLAVSDRAIENETLAVCIEADGSLTLTDKRSRQVYRRLLTYEDCADIGDGWVHGPASGDQAFTSTASHTSVALVHSGRQMASLRVRTLFELPAEFDFNLMKRAEPFAALEIDTTLTLRAGSDVLEAHTTVHNCVRDHRLRVLFPSGAAQAQTYLADTPFDVVERPIALRADNALYREPEVETKPQQSWFAVQSEGRGLAVISSGLLESAVIDRPERPMALTLLRATRRTVNTNGEPLGQLQGDLDFRYWITPLSARADPARLCELGQRLAGGLRAIQLDATERDQHRTPHELPLSAAFVRLEGSVVMTSLRQVENSLEIRLFNPTPERQRARLDLSGWAGSTPAPRTAQPVDFESHALGSPEPLLDGQIPLALGPKQIVTLRLE
jgi:alpha-mannosidase